MSNQKIKTCEYCDDGNGECVFPYYGLGPHTHKDGILGSTEFTGEIPENFSPDGDGLGVYTHCLNCGGDGTYDGVVLKISDVREILSNASDAMDAESPSSVFTQTGIPSTWYDHHLVAEKNILDAIKAQEPAND